MSHSLIRIFLLIAVVASMTWDGRGQTAAKARTIGHSLEMYSVGSPKISPDGKRVVYEQTRTNWDANAFETDLWIADAATGERHQLTTSGRSCNPVKMVLYDGFGHPINKPKQQRAVMEENENWFGHYIWGDPLAPALTPRPSEKKDDKDAKGTPDK